RLLQLADSLGLSMTSLCQFGVGWATEHRSWSFPMRDAESNVVGIRLRRPDGFKFAVKGGKEGLFIPEDRNAQSSPLLIAEGVTDAAALLDMGFTNVVGRPIDGDTAKWLASIGDDLHAKLSAVGLTSP